MNAEKFVKNEAKKNLSGNWPIAVFSVLTLLFIPIVFALVLSVPYSLLGDTDSITEALSGSPVTAVLFVVFHLAAVLSVVFLSPIYSGFVRVFSELANGKTVDPADLLYFFDNKTRYKSAVKFMTGIIIKCVGIFILVELPSIAVIMMGNIGTAVVGILTVIGLLAAFCIILRFMFSIYAFSYENYEPKAAASFGENVAKGNTMKLVKLTISFFPWLLLMFFVVPLVYIYPYMTCSYFVSIKYLVQNYKENADMQNNVLTEDNSFFSAVNGINLNNPANAIINEAAQIPPITENKVRTNHFRMDDNMFRENGEEKPVQISPDIKEKSSVEKSDTEYHSSNREEDKTCDFSEKGGSVGSDL